MHRCCLGCREVVHSVLRSGDCGIVMACAARYQAGVRRAFLAGSAERALGCVANGTEQVGVCAVRRRAGNRSNVDQIRSLASDADARTRARRKNHRLSWERPDGSNGTEPKYRLELHYIVNGKEHNGHSSEVVRN